MSIAEYFIENKGLTHERTTIKKFMVAITEWMYFT